MRIARSAMYLAIPILLALLPTACIESLPDICIFHSVFGFECPGCGMTRALSALVHGDAASALRYNRLVLVVFPLLCVVVAKMIWKEMKSRPYTGTSRGLCRIALEGKEGAHGSKEP